LAPWDQKNLGPDPRDIYSQLLAAIHSGQLGPYAQIREKVPGQHVSQASVHDALIRLEREGLVVRVANKDTRVVNLDHQAINDLIEVRIPLEQLACRLAHPRFIDSSVFAQSLERFAAIGNNLPGADERFHHFIWDLVANQRLVSTLKQLSAPMFLIAAILRRKGLQNLGERIESHRALLDGLRTVTPADEDLEQHNIDLIALDAIVADHVRDAYARFLNSEIDDMLALSKFPDGDAAPKPTPVMLSKHQEFLHWVPANALILDSDYRVVYANEEFGRFVGCAVSDLMGKQFEHGFWREVNRLVLEKRHRVLAAHVVNGRRHITMCFPIRFDDQLLVGELGIDVTALLPLRSEGQAVVRPLRTVFPAQNRPSGVRVDANLLAAFFEELPAVATWKDRQGRMTWANPEYEVFTRKKLISVIGRMPLENWPHQTGGMILTHDALVRERQTPYLTIDQFTFPDSDPQPRLTVRFPIFDSTLQLEETASLGLEYKYLNSGAAMFERLGEDGTDLKDLGPAPTLRTDDAV
jgi:DNA-binding GntR family transcriptional regulator